MKEKIKKYLPFIIFFIIMLILHINTNRFRDDQDVFGIALKNKTMFEYLSMRWNIWTSRMFLEFFEVTMNYINICYWKVINSFLYTLIAYSASKLFTKQTLKENIIVCVSFLLFPFIIMWSAGWISTTINYVWTCALGMYAMTILKDEYNNNKVSIIRYILAFLALLFAVNQEQMCCVILACSLVSLFVFKKESKKNKWPIIMLIISVISFIVIILCPGNKLRTIAEINTWFPEFKNYGLLSKTYLGIIPTVDLLLKNNILIIVLLSVLSIGFCLKNKNNINKYISLTTLSFVSLLTIFKPIIIDSFSGMEKLFDYFSYTAYPSYKLENFSSLIPLGIAIAMALIILYLVYAYFDKQKLLGVFVLLLGLGTRFMMGFSPTVFVSGERTSFFLYTSIIIIILKVIIDQSKSNSKKLNLSYIVLITFVLLNIINNIYAIATL